MKDTILTWLVPNIPGGEVTHVRDKHGRLYERKTYADGSVYYKAEGSIMLIEWPELLCTRGPITNATGEMAK